MDDKYQPAYDGARFDKKGYCLKHSMVRLCKPAPNGSSSKSSLISSDGDRAAMQTKYIIIRKICPMCGEHSLRNDRKLNKPVSLVSLFSAKQIISKLGLSIISYHGRPGFMDTSRPHRLGVPQTVADCLRNPVAEEVSKMMIAIFEAHPVFANVTILWLTEIPRLMKH